MNNMDKKFLKIDQIDGVYSEEHFNDQDYGLHTHNYYEIELLTGGRAIHTINDYTYEIGAGDIFVLSPSEFHSLKVIEPITTLNLKFTEKSVSASLLYKLISHDGSITYKLSEEEYQKLLPIFKTIANDNSDMDEYHMPFLRNLCECIIMKIISCLGIKNKTTKGKKSIYAAALYINRNFRSDITLATLAEKAGYSKNHFSMVFNELFGMGVKEYLNEVRISHARKMLVATGEPITQICYACGFNSFPAFSRAFKEKYGTSPRSYRAKQPLL